MILLGLCTTGTAYAQSGRSATDSGVEILKLKWEKQVSLPRNFDPSVIPENGIFSSMQSRTAVPGSAQAPYGDEARRDAAARSAALSPVDYFPKSPARLPVSYVYSLTVRNVGTKRIVAIAWDYLFVSSESQTVVGDHHLSNYVRVNSGASVTLKASQRTLPVGVVAAKGETKKAQKPLEKAIIQCVVYEDESTWQNPFGQRDTCDFLRKNQPVKTRKSKQQPK